MAKVRQAELVNHVLFAFGRYIDYRLNEVQPELKELFGPIDYESRPLDFGKFTFYYNQEMGEGRIEGRIISFKELIHPAELPLIKRRTNTIEDQYREGENRQINLDPGFIHHSQFVLASTKHWGNRLYIGRGVYAEVTLIFVDGTFQPLKYTYPNYASPEYIEELTSIRKRYLKKRKS